MCWTLSQLQDSCDGMSSSQKLHRKVTVKGQKLGNKLSLSLLSFSSASRLGRLMRCIRCPVAYHTGDSCVAAGSVALTHHIMICSSHGSAKRNGLLTSPINVGWCFLCARGELSQLFTLTFLSCSRDSFISDPEQTEQTNAEAPNFTTLDDFSLVTDSKISSSYLHFTLEHQQDLISLHDCSFFFIYHHFVMQSQLQ